MERKEQGLKPAALVYSHSVSPRLHYVVQFLSQYYGLTFSLVYDEDVYRNTKHDCKINYGYHALAAGEIFIHSHALLFESTIRPVKIECFGVEDYTAFFKTEGTTGFDLFAGIFYLLSRYEEYLPHNKDSYGRYAHENAVAYREGFLQLPLVNIWLEHFRKLLAEREPAFAQPASTFSFLPTYDIDMAWVFRNKGFIRNAGGMLLLLLKGKFGKMLQRYRVVKGKQPDPYDAYAWMDTLHQRYGLQPLYFFLVAAKAGKFDKNIDTGDPEFLALLRELSSKYDTGLHPSWASGDQPSLLAAEKAFLGKAIHKTVTASRQHFIRFHLPDTYRLLLKCGISDDYSMGYGTINGFRASVATPFYWYDLKQDETTSLLLHPFCFMDANSFYEQKETPESALQELLHYQDVIRKVNGKMITVWHNSFLGTDENFRGWKEVYEKFIAQTAT